MVITIICHLGKKKGGTERPGVDGSIYSLIPQSKAWRSRAMQLMGSRLLPVESLNRSLIWLPVQPLGRLGSCQGIKAPQGKWGKTGLPGAGMMNWAWSLIKQQRGEKAPCSHEAGCHGGH